MMIGRERRKHHPGPKNIPDHLKLFLARPPSPKMTSSRQACRRLARASNARHSSSSAVSPFVLSRKYRRRQSQSVRPLIPAFSALDINRSLGTHGISTVVSPRSKGVCTHPFHQRCTLICRHSDNFASAEVPYHGGDWRTQAR
jgi:hypothetical protein